LHLEERSRFADEPSTAFVHGNGDAVLLEALKVKPRDFRGRLIQPLDGHWSGSSMNDARRWAGGRRYVGRWPHRRLDHIANAIDKHVERHAIARVGGPAILLDPQHAELPQAPS
jgi:hypothetical protein